MNDLNFTAIDFETANGLRNSICQIGICRVENGIIVYAESFLIQPPKNEYSHWNVGVHCISPDITQNKPLFPEIWNEIRHYFEGQLIVAHNAVFDIDCLKQTLEYYKLDSLNVNCDCTYQMSGLSLIDLAESLYITVLPHHDALNDAQMCAEAYIKLKNGQKPDSQKITKKEAKSPFEGHERLCGNVLKPELENADSNSPFYNKKVVFTGVLSNFGREEAAEVVKKMGADIDTCISRKTDLVIIGTGAGPSKLKKIAEYNNAGSNIKMIYDPEFLKLINHGQ